MKVKVTVRELMDKGVWDEVCELLGLNPWCVNEGLMDSSEEIELTETQAKQMGLLEKEMV